MKDRIIQIRKKYGLTQGEFGQKIGLTDPMISMFESGKKAPQDGTIKLICFTFNINEDWLRYGNGEMLSKPIESPSEKEEQILLDTFRQLSPETRAAILKIIEDMPKIPK